LSGFALVLAPIALVVDPYDTETLGGAEIAGAARTPEVRTVRMWTDDFSNLLSSVTVKSIF